MKIVIDVFGADMPEEIVKGAITSVNLIDDVEIILTGDKDKIQKVIDEIGYVGDKIEIVHAPEVISCDESPTMAIRRKKDSSLVAALDILKTREDVIGMISAGSTGAVLAGGLFVIGRMEGVKRPALAPFLPTVTDKRTLLIDCGANVDCKPEYLRQFAIMGSIYVKAMCGVKKPKVALISNGVEDHKGNEQIHQSFELLKNEKEINFVGNMEAREMFSGDYDVLVCDGFTGNVAMKAFEGTAKGMGSLLKKEIKSSLGGMIGYLFMRRNLKRFQEHFNADKVGGATLFGVDGTVIKAHGSSSQDAFKNAIDLAYKAVKGDVVNKMKEFIQNHPFEELPNE